MSMEIFEISFEDLACVGGGEVGATGMGDDYHYTGYTSPVTSVCATITVGPGFANLSYQSCANSDGTSSSQLCLNVGVSTNAGGVAINACRTTSDNTGTGAPSPFGGLFMAGSADPLRSSGRVVEVY